MTTIFERDDCLVTLEIGAEIEYTVRATDHQLVISTPLDGLETLAAHLGGGQLADASRSSAERDGFERLMVASIGSALRRWCHEAGLSSVWTVDGRRARREHIVAVVPQPVTGRMITLSLAFSPHEGGQVVFTEEYRGPAEVLGYSYTTGLRSEDAPRLADHLETTTGRRTAGEPEDRLIAALDELVAQGTIDPVAGQGGPRALFEACSARPVYRPTSKRSVSTAARSWCRCRWDPIRLRRSASRSTRSARSSASRKATAPKARPGGTPCTNCGSATTNSGNSCPG
ncbi:MAG TPA: hypothetical protein VG497_13635 [Kribbella sp.]|nr:hypothetical protein [Kribbella sp.]